jgi:serine/threonine protein phosphatase 1
MIYVIGDIHGAYKALIQCLERSNFDYEKDELITLGDICDGYSEVYECVEELLKIKNRTDIRGNHDDCFSEFIHNGEHPWQWLQGGEGTLKSYCKHLDKEYYVKMHGYDTYLTSFDIPEPHVEFFNNQVTFYIDKDLNIFVHGGFNRHFHIYDDVHNTPIILMWDRDLWYQALSFSSVTGGKFKNDFNEIFIGHTPTINWKADKPMHSANVWNLDTGCGYKNGKLTIMNLETKEYWQSDRLKDLYPNENGR